ncbi:MAG: hypothetical protein PHV16_01215 [Candidatus Nanoarchaeia archaeon]|nr:hypothetical protein [Candidatus Nanoarchaeia archaeon]
MAIKGKRGVFFTLIAVLVVSVLVIAFSYNENFTSKNRVPIISSRVKTSSNFVRDLEESYIKASLQTSSYNAINSILLYIENYRTFEGLGNEQELNDMFKEVLINGSIKGAKLYQGYGISLMNGNTFEYRLNRIEQASKNFFNLRTDFKKEDIEVAIFQTNDTGPWYIGVNLTLEYTVDADVAYWNRTKTFTIFLDLREFNDPLFLVNPKTAAHRKINPTPFNSSEWDIDTLKIHINSGTYRHEPNASSYLNRLFNSAKVSECCGIESFVNETLCRQIEEKSYVDFCFWSDVCDPGTKYGENLYNITGITNETYPFKLDAYHAARYNVLGQADRIN